MLTATILTLLSAGFDDLHAKKLKLTSVGSLNGGPVTHDDLREESASRKAGLSSSRVGPSPGIRQ